MPWLMTTEMGVLKSNHCIDIMSVFNFYSLKWSIFHSVVFLLGSEVNQLYLYMCHPSFGLPSHLGSHRTLSRVPCAIQ